MEKQTSKFKGVGTSISTSKIACSSITGVALVTSTTTPNVANVNCGTTVSKIKGIGAFLITRRAIKGAISLEVDRDSKEQARIGNELEGAPLSLFPSLFGCRVNG